MYPFVIIRMEADQKLVNCYKCGKGVLASNIVLHELRCRKPSVIRQSEEKPAFRLHKERVPLSKTEDFRKPPVSVVEE